MATWSPSMARSPATRPATETCIAPPAISCGCCEACARTPLRWTVQRDHLELAALIEQRTNERAAQRMPRCLDQRNWTLVDRRGFHERFENRSQVANRNLFPQQLLQYFLNFTEAHQLGHQLLHQLRVGVSQTIDQPLGLMPRQQILRILLDDL